jgi:MFS family permease
MAAGGCCPHRTEDSDEVFVTSGSALEPELRRWAILAVASLLFFFITAATFSSLGGVLYVMSSELRWSQSAIGTCYAILGLTCGLSSPLPAFLMRRLGTCATMTAGAGVLAAGFLLATLAHGLPVLMVATGLLGLGFTLTANIPGVYLLASWFPGSTPRVMGAYFMAGGMGAVAGPPLINALVQAAGWRVHWLLMTLIAAGLAVLSGLIVRDRAPRDAGTADTRTGDGVPDAAGVWSPRAALLTRQFLIVALTMLVVQTVLTTVHGMIVTHLAGLGASTAFGSLVMSILGATDALAKGAAGPLCARVGAQRMALAGILALAVSLGLLPFAASPLVACAFGVLLGAAGGATWLALHLLLLEYFGRALAAEMVSSATLITTAAVVGPVAAGRTADVTGSFLPFFYMMAAVLLANLVLGATLRPPRPAATSAMAFEESAAR